MTSNRMLCSRSWTTSNRIVGIPPLLVILALIIGGQLWGFLGIIISVPVAAVLRELARDYEASRLPEPKESTS